MLRHFGLATVLWGTTAFAALAQSAGLALIVANERYSRITPARGASALLRGEAALAAAGFRADQASDLSGPALRAALTDLSARIESEAAERVVIGYAGYMVNNASGTWLLGTEAERASFATIDTVGLRLEMLLAVAGEVQGGALVAIADLGSATPANTAFNSGAFPAVAVPQGVTLAMGPPTALAGFLADVARPGTSLREAAARQRGVTLSGFVPRYLDFLPEGFEPALDAERRAFDEASAASSLEGWRAYLTAYPSGSYSAEARARLAALENTPDRVEAALALTRDERRAIQRHLALLGFNPRGIDGVFGPGTRSAIGGWQAREGFAASTFLDRGQVQQLATQAGRRAAELEEEARQRREQQERADRAFWRDTGAGQDEAGLRSYLSRYPEGFFSALARDRLQQIEGERRAAAEARDRAAFDIARAEDTPPAYERYLRENPRGAFQAEARARIEELTRPAGPVLDLAAARAEEEALGLPLVTRVLIEQRLEASGYAVGPVDGAFDDATRQGIRAYQRDAGVPETGYLNQMLAARLLAGAIFGRN